MNRRAGEDQDFKRIKTLQLAGYKVFYRNGNHYMAMIVGEYFGISLRSAWFTRTKLTPRG